MRGRGLARPSVEGDPLPREVRIGAQVIGGERVVTLAGPQAGPQIAHVSLRYHHGDRDADEELVRVRNGWAGPLAVEPFSADDLPAVAEHADTVLVGAEWMQDFRLLAATARLGVPVIVQRGHHATMDEWLGAAEYCTAEGNRDVILCESGTRTYLSSECARLDLALLREAGERSGVPVIADVAASPELAGAAVAAGADGLLLGTESSADDVARAAEFTEALTALVRPAPPEPAAGSHRSMDEARGAIDRVDAALAALLERRARLAGEVQRLKPVGGWAGRDQRREREVIEGMARRAPGLGEQRLQAIMDAVIEAGIDLAETTESYAVLVARDEIIS